MNAYKKLIKDLNKAQNEVVGQRFSKKIYKVVAKKVSKIITDYFESYIKVKCKKDPDDPKNQIECDCCGYPAPLAKFRDGMPERDFYFCEVCAVTHIAGAVIYPALHEQASLEKSVGYIANMILDEIRK